MARHPNCSRASGPGWGLAGLHSSEEAATTSGRIASLPSMKKSESSLRILGGQQYRLRARGLPGSDHRNKYFHYPLTPLNALFGMGLVNSLGILSSYLAARLRRISGGLRSRRSKTGSQISLWAPSLPCFLDIHGKGWGIPWRPDQLRLGRPGMNQGTQPHYCDLERPVQAEAQDHQDSCRRVHVSACRRRACSTRRCASTGERGQVPKWWLRYGRGSRYRRDDERCHRCPVHAGLTAGEKLRSRRVTSILCERAAHRDAGHDGPAAARPDVTWPHARGLRYRNHIGVKLLSCAARHPSRTTGFMSTSHPMSRTARVTDFAGTSRQAMGRSGRHAAR